MYISHSLDSVEHVPSSLYPLLQTKTKSPSKKKKLLRE